MNGKKRKKLEEELRKEILGSSRTPNIDYSNFMSNGHDSLSDDIIAKYYFDLTISAEDYSKRIDLNAFDCLCKKRNLNFNKEDMIKKCENCKNIEAGFDVDGRYGGCFVPVCSKNNLNITNDEHYCDMFEEKEEKNKKGMIIKELKLVSSGIEITATDSDNSRSKFVFCVDLKFADKLTIGQPINITFN